MARTVYHVVPVKGGDPNWRVRRQGSSKASVTFADKVNAVARAKELAKGRRPSQIIVHGRDGNFQYEHTYGSDPEKYPD